MISKKKIKVEQLYFIVCKLSKDKKFFLVFNFKQNNLFNISCLLPQKVRGINKTSFKSL